ncbi:nucleoside triphosphate pyrophosphohydrolase family protein [Ralstonia nicotianae]
MREGGVNANPLTLAEYQERACASNQFRGKNTAIEQLRFGLYGEIGSVLSLVKKSHRDLQPADLQGLKEELGDALWYLTTTTVEYGSSLQEVGAAAMTELQRRFGVNSNESNGRLTFEEFDGLVAFSRNQLNDGQKLIRLRQLGIDCGRLLAESTEKDLATSLPVQILSTLLADMVLVGALFGQSFVCVAENNLRKSESRWPPKDTPHIPLFDEGRSVLEKFPRKFSMRFIEQNTPAGKPYVVQQMNEVNIGDRLTDNRSEPDGYRFHDVFHLAYLVHLGWSPVIRALLKLKRKSDPNIDENQDGARAIIIEEGIATWIFNHAHRRNHFTNFAVGRLDHNLLKQVLDMVEGYEVAACPMWQWERAIIDGFQVFRQLREAGGGIIHVDLTARILTFEKITSTISREPSGSLSD